MNDRTRIAAQMMAARMQNPHKALSDRVAMAEQAVKDADALIAALAESEAERPQDDQRLVADATGLGAVEFLTPYASPQWWGAVPGDATAQAAGEYDEVGDWRKYMTSKEATKRVAAGLTNYVDDAFTWKDTPQGYEFWKRLAYDKASDADKARAQDFARRVLEAMEESDD